MHVVPSRRRRRWWLGRSASCTKGRFVRAVELGSLEPGASVRASVTLPSRPPPTPTCTARAASPAPTERPGTTRTPGGLRRCAGHAGSVSSDRLLAPAQRLRTAAPRRQPRAGGRGNTCSTAAATATCFSAGPAMTTSVAAECHIIHARDGESEVLDCGPGVDTVRANPT